MDISFYKFLHLAGIILLFLSLGSLLQNGILSRSRTENPCARSMAALHGLALLIILVSGFGMLAKLGMHWPLPTWAYGKFIIWLALGGIIAFSYKKAELARKAWWLTLALGAAAVYLALFK